MKYSLQILLLIFCLITSSMFACDCKTSKDLKATQDQEFKNSSCIFIGEVLQIDPNNNVFEIKVTESFKGVEVSKTYKGVYSQYCGPIIDQKGKWLIYGNYNAEHLIEINTCGLSRSFKNPKNNILAAKPPNPSPNENELESEKKRLQWILKAKSNLENEINDLRKKQTKKGL